MNILNDQYKIAMVPIECHKRGAKLEKLSLFLLNSVKAFSLLSGSLNCRMYATTFSNS